MIQSLIKKPLRAILSAKARDGRLVIVDSLALDAVKTKDLVAAVKGLGVNGSAILVDEPVDRNLALSARNATHLAAARSTAINAFDLLRYDTVVLTEAAAARLAEVLQP